MRAFLPALALLTAAPAFAQAADIPRTPDGRPDLQGFWASDFMTPLERPDGVDALIVPRDQLDAVLKKMTPEIPEVFDPEIEFNPFPRTLLEMNGELRSSLLVKPEDGKLPLTALAQASVKQFKRTFDNPEDRPGAERCIDSMNHPPFQITTALIPHQFVQTPGAIVITTEDLDSTRIVALTGPMPPDAMRSRAGHSRGTWEGDALVVTTDHFATGEARGYTWHGEAMITDDSRVVERFRMLSADQMLYQFTVEDLSLYKAPWLAEYVIERTVRPVYEYACHEANHGMTGILLAARMGRQEEKKP